MPAVFVWEISVCVFQINDVLPYLILNMYQFCISFV